MKKPSKRDVLRMNFERGRVRNGGITETKVFKLFPSGKEEKLKPNNQSNESKRTNQGTDTYRLPLPGRYRVETIIIKKGRTRSGSAIYIIKRDGRIETEKWKGDFLPQFFLQ